jgi:molybdenum-dependent DNA-binding transcriptional regulator ModE
MQTQTLEQVKREAIANAIFECGSIAKAAKRLGMNRSTLYQYLKNEPINRPLIQARALSVKCAQIAKREKLIEAAEGA